MRRLTEFAPKFFALVLNSFPDRIFVTAIGTDSGKTLTSAVLVNHLRAAYWKPVQCGSPTDSSWMTSMLPEAVIIPERYCLKTPASPHFAAENEGITISLEDFSVPDVQGPLVVEGAGGLMVPLNGNEVLADLITRLDLQVVLVINHYLGALNHSLLTITELERRKIPVAGLVFNGLDFQNAESVIQNRCPAPCILRIPKLDEVNRTAIEELSNKVNLNGL